VLSLDGERLSYRAPKGAMTPALREAIAAERTDLVELLRSEADRIARILSPMQRAMWFHWRANPGDPAYNTGVAAMLHGALDSTALRTAVATLIARHPVLASCYPDVDGEPQRQIASSSLDMVEEEVSQAFHFGQSLPP